MSRRAVLCGDEAELLHVPRILAHRQREVGERELRVARRREALDPRARRGERREEDRLREEEAAARRWLAQAEVSFDAGVANAQAVLFAALATTRAGVERLAAARDAQLALADLTLAVGEDPRNVK